MCTHRTDHDSDNLDNLDPTAADHLDHVDPTAADYLLDHLHPTAAVIWRCAKAAIQNPRGKTCARQTRADDIYHGCICPEEPPLTHP